MPLFIDGQLALGKKKITLKSSFEIPNTKLYFHVCVAFIFQ